MPGPRIAPAGGPSLQLRGQGRSKSTLAAAEVCQQLDDGVEGPFTTTSAPLCSGQGPARALGVCDLGPSAEHRQEHPSPDTLTICPLHAYASVCPQAPWCAGLGPAASDKHSEGCWAAVLCVASLCVAPTIRLPPFTILFLALPPVWALVSDPLRY